MRIADGEIKALDDALFRADRVPPDRDITGFARRTIAEWLEEES